MNSFAAAKERPLRLGLNTSYTAANTRLRILFRSSRLLGERTNVSRGLVRIAVTTSTNAASQMATKRFNNNEALNDRNRNIADDDDDDDAVITKQEKKMLFETNLLQAKEHSEKLKNYLEKRKKKIILKASEVSALKMPQEIYADQARTPKNVGLKSIEERVKYSAKECSDFGQRFSLNLNVLSDYSNSSDSDKNDKDLTTTTTTDTVYTISDSTVKQFMRDAVELIPACLPGSKFGAFKSVVSTSYDSLCEETESRFTGHVYYRLLKKHTPQVKSHAIVFERLEKTEEAKEREVNLESTDGWPFAFRMSLVAADDANDDDINDTNKNANAAKKVSLELRLFWPKEELDKFGKQALERDGLERFDSFSRKVEQMLYLIDQNIVARGKEPAVSPMNASEISKSKRGAVKKEKKRKPKPKPKHFRDEEEEEEDEDGSKAHKEIALKLKKRLGRAPFASEIHREFLNIKTH